MRWRPPLAGIVRTALTFVALAVLLSPFLFIIYRLAVFNTVPRDDYAGFLLWTAGNPEGGLPESPYCYRVLSMLAALPFYLAVPALHLTNIAATLTPDYLRATLALSMLAYTASIVAAMLTAHMGQHKAGLTRVEAVVAGALLLALIAYTQITAIDPLAIMAIAAGIYLVERPVLFAVLILLSVLANEKVALVLAAWLSVRCVLHRNGRELLWRQWAVALTGVALYAAMVSLVKVPGNVYQVDPSAYPLTVAKNVTAWFSGRGLLLNALPIAVLTVIGIAGHRLPLPNPARMWFRATDLLVIPVLLVIALVVTHLFQAGRIVSHAAPLFVVPAVLALRRPA